MRSVIHIRRRIYKHLIVAVKEGGIFLFFKLHLSFMRIAKAHVWGAEDSLW